MPAGGRKKGAVLAGPAAGLKAAPKRKLEEALAALGATGKAGDVVRVPGAGISAAPVVVAVGLGAGPWTDETLRRAAGDAVRSLAGSKRAVLALPVETAAALDAVAEGALLGAYSFDAFRVDSKAAQKSPVDRITLAVQDAKDGGTARVARAKAIAGAVNLARDLVNTPASDLPPAALVAAAADAVDGLASRSRCSTRRRSPQAGTAASSASARARPTRRGSPGSPTAPRAPPRTSRWSARASRSTPAASPSSPRSTWTR